VTCDFRAEYTGRRTCGRNSVLKDPGRVLNTSLNPITEGWVGVGEICCLSHLGVHRGKAWRADLSGNRGCRTGLYSRAGAE
jgi:hypothetical protein